MSVSEQVAYINYIRLSGKRAKLFDKLTKDEKREFVETMEGDKVHLDDLLEDFVDCRRSGQARLSF